jgi:hypothetical protein
MRNISLGAAKKNVDASGLEGALTKAKGDVAQLKVELLALKKGATKVDDSSSRGSKESKAAEAGAVLALAEVQRRLAAKEEQAEALKDANAVLRAQLAAAERKVTDLAAGAAAVADAPPPPSVKRPPASEASGFEVGDRVRVRDGDEPWEWGTVEKLEFNEPLVRKDGWDDGDAYFWKDTRRPTAAELAAGSDDDSDDSGSQLKAVADDSDDDSDDGASEKKPAAAATPRRRPSAVSGVASGAGAGRGAAAKPAAGRGRGAPAASKSPVRTPIKRR